MIAPAPMMRAAPAAAPVAPSSGTSVTCGRFAAQAEPTVVIAATNTRTAENRDMFLLGANRARLGASRPGPVRRPQRRQSCLHHYGVSTANRFVREIGRASCRERV